MIHIGKPYIDRLDGWSRLCADVTIDGKQQTAWFAVEPEYEKYLTVERSDAFVVSFLTAAMLKGEDIVCQTPVTKRLKYQLSQYLIPAMAANMDIYKAVKITADCADDKLECAGAVATGWTGGVDCMFTFLNHSSVDCETRLTHLMVANNGAVEGKNCHNVFLKMVDNAKQSVARDCGLGVVGIDSNIQLILDERFLAVADFRHAGSVLALQKLFGVYLNSAGYEFEKFAFVQENCAYYELLLMHCFETDCTRFYSSGGTTPRIDKLKALADFAPARKYLHPCIYVSNKNCGVCGKCVRTLGALYALGVIDKFGEVFDLEAFEANKETIISKIIANRNSQHYGEVLKKLEQNKEEISPEIMRRVKTFNAAKAVALRYQKQLKEEAKETV